MIYCSVDGCFSNNTYGKDKRTLFRCPMKNLQRALKWHEFCGDPTIKCHNRLFICDLHFLKDDFYIGENQKLFLKSYALPCLNGPVKREDTDSIKCESDIAGISAESYNQQPDQNLLHTSPLNVSLPSSSTQPSKPFTVKTECVSRNDLKTSSNVIIQMQANKIPSGIIRKPVDPKVKVSILKPVSSLPKSAKVVPINMITNTDGSKVFIPLRQKPSVEKVSEQDCSKSNVIVKDDCKKVLEKPCSEPNKFLHKEQGKSPEISSAKPTELLSCSKPMIPLLQKGKELNIIENASLNSSGCLKRQKKRVTKHCLSKMFKFSNEHFEISLGHDSKCNATEEENNLISDSESDVFTETRKIQICRDDGLDFDVSVETKIEFETEENNQILDLNDPSNPKDSTSENFDSGDTHDASFLDKKGRLHVYGEKKEWSSTTKSDKPFQKTCKKNPGGRPRKTNPLIASAFNQRTPVLNKYAKKRKTAANLNDPKFSIAATADSLGAFNSFIEKPLEKVDLKKNEWHKLYISSGMKYPKLTRSHMGSMVNQLREKLPLMNEKDMLDVLFVLNMMSVYPGVPDRIKEEMFQRLCMVFVATMFKWDTALALGKRVRENDPVTGTLLESGDLENTDTLSGKGKGKSLEVYRRLKKLPKHPTFPFEIIVHEKPKGKKN